MLKHFRQVYTSIYDTAGACTTGVTSCSGGVCTCAAGYTGDDCCQCAPGYYKSTDGTCKRKTKQYEQGF